MHNPNSISFFKSDSSSSDCASAAGGTASTPGWGNDPHDVAKTIKILNKKINGGRRQGQIESDSEVAQSCPTLCDPWTVAHQAPLSMGFSRQEYGSGLPFPSPGDLPDPGIEPRSPTLQADVLTSAPPGKPR